MIGALAALGLLVWLAVPGGGKALLPLLLTLVCPLSMAVMMWQMRRAGHGTSTGVGDSPDVAAGAGQITDHAPRQLIDRDEAARA